MRHYELRLIDTETGVLMSGAVLDSRRESDVFAMAMKLASPRRAAEVWQGARLVCRIASGANQLPWSRGPVY